MTTDEAMPEVYVCLYVLSTALSTKGQSVYLLISLPNKALEESKEAGKALAQRDAICDQFEICAPQTNYIYIINSVDKFIQKLPTHANIRYWA